jgi:two-component system, cell cycle sensor histidine kinase and response regulator CckA
MPKHSSETSFDNCFRGAALAHQGNLPPQWKCPTPPGAGGNVQVQTDRDGRQQEWLLLSLLENIPGIVYRGMPNWSLTFVGGEVERLTGYTSREMLSELTLWRSLIHPDDIEPVCESIRNAVCRRERILRVECRIVRRNGEVRWVSDRRQMIYDDNGMLLCVDGLCMDITEQKRAEEERRLLAAAVECAADASMVTDSEWNVRYVNPVFEKVTGYGREEILGRNLYMLAAGEENTRVYLEIQDKVRSGTPWKGNLKNRRKDGVPLDLDIVISPIRGPGGKIVNHVVSLRDITREVQLEKQAKAAQHMEAVGTLAGGIAHDFNNALTGIIGFADLLRMRLGKEPKLQGDVDEILKCAERASTLTRQLLAFARRQVIEPVVLDLNGVVRDISRLMKKVSGEQVEVRTRLTDGIPCILADRGQLEQILLNLCLNSRDSMPGGGEFRVSTDAVAWEGERVEEHAVMPAGHYVLMAVSDSGTGMDDATRKRAFEPYFTTKARGKGTGLGLSMVYGIVKQNSGFVFLDTSPGKGTTFRIYFPASKAVPAEKEEKKEAAVKGGAETILLAEDEEAILNLAERALRSYGYEILTARDGAEAVALFEAHPEISIAVLDVVMPRMGGKEAFDAMRLLRPDLKTLFTSGYSTDRIHESFVILPGIEFLPKPYGPASLARRVREVLDKV